MKTKRKGFTLIELLAVIIIISVITLITVPIVLNTVSKVDMNAFKISVKEVTNNIDKYLLKNSLKQLPDCGIEQVIIRDIDFLKNRTNFSEDSYVCFDNDQKCDYIYAKSSDDDKTAMYAYGCLDSVVITKLTGDLDLSPPSYNNFSFDRTSSSITVYINWYDDSQIKEIKYAIREKGFKKWSDWQESNVFKKLKNNTKYEIKSMAKNKSDIIGYANGITTTEDIDEPEYSLSDYNWSDSKVVTITYPTPRANEEYIYSYSLDDGNTWVETSDKTKKITFTKNGNVIARVFDGDNYKTASSFAVSKIDSTLPSCTLTVIQGTLGNNNYYKDNVTVKLTTSIAGASGLSFSAPTTSTTEIYNNSISSGSSYSTGTLVENGSLEVYGYVKNGVGKTATCKITLKKDSNPTGLSLTLQKETSKEAVSQGDWSTENVVITAVPTYSTAPSGYSYQWYKDGTTISGVTSKTYTATSSGTYKVKVTSGSGVSKEGSAILNIDKCITPTISISGKKASAGTAIASRTWTDEDITITASPTCSNGGSSGYSYQWYKNNIAISGATSKTYKATETADYSVRVTLGNGKYATATYGAYIDKTTPSCILTTSGTTGGAPGNKWYTSDVTATVTTSKAGASGLSFSDPTTSTTEIYNKSISSGNSSSASATFSKEGTYVVKTYIKNGVGKKATCSDKIKIDTTIPEINFPTKTEYCLDDKITIDFKDSVSGINESSFCNLYNGNKVTSDGFAKKYDITGSETFQMSEYGKFTLKCRILNNAYLRDSKNYTFTVKPCVGDTYTFYAKDALSQTSVNCGHEGGSCYQECYGKLCYSQGPKLDNDKLYLIKDNSYDTGVQYGPYMNFARGCYKITYYGYRLNSGNLKYMSYEFDGANYTDQINPVGISSNVSYKIYFEGANTVNGLEFRLDSRFTNDDSNPPYLNLIKVEYLGETCD